MSDTTQAPGVSYNTSDTEQSETAIVATRPPFPYPSPAVVVGFNDNSIDQTWDRPEFEYVPGFSDPQERIARRGVSLMGWSISFDAGQSWQYRGKVRPPEGWSAIWADPSLAVDPTNPTYIYYAQLGVSNAAWDGITEGADETFESPGRMVDSVCVARSTDGGISFAERSCKIVGSPGQPDRTAIAVDGTGAVWIAYILAQAGATVNRVLCSRCGASSDWSDFGEPPQGQPPYPGVLQPHLKTDPYGGVWFGGLVGGGFTIQGTKALEAGWYSSGVVTGPLAPQEQIVLSPTVALRNGQTFDFALGHNESGIFAMRAVYEYKRADDRRALRVVECNEVAFCFAPEEWDTAADDGQQAMPVIAYADRGEGDSSSPAWMIAYLTTDGVPSGSPSSNSAYVRVEARSPFALNVQGYWMHVFLGPSDVTPASWAACPRQNEGAGGYWGDYFGLTQMQDSLGLWWSIAAFSDSSGVPPCTASTYLAHPLHVASWRW